MGIPPKRLRNYGRGFSSDDLIQSEYREGKLSNEAMKLMNHYNISFPERYNARVMKELKDNLENPNYTKPVALYILNKSDWNGAFSSAQTQRIGDNFWAPIWGEEHPQEYEKLMKGYNLLIFEEEKDSQVVNRIKEVGKKYGGLDLLILGGHGEPEAIHFGECSHESCSIDTKDDKLFKGLNKYFKPNAITVLESCSTGKGGINGKNIAKKIKKYTKTTVFAPEYPTSIEDFKLSENGRLIRPMYNKYEKEYPNMPVMHKF